VRKSDTERVRKRDRQTGRECKEKEITEGTKRKRQK